MFVERNSSLLAERFLFYIDDENNVAISETQEYFVLVPSGYSFAISVVNLAFLVSVFSIL